MSSPAASPAGRIETHEGDTVVHLTIFRLPDASRPEPNIRADVVVVREFQRRFGELMASRVQRYQDDPATYGHWDWTRLRVELHPATGIEVEGVENDLLAIAGDMAPDVIYINFRKSDTYIQQGILYPLDRPEDNYLHGMSEQELEQRIHAKIWPVIRRKGPNGQTHVWAMPYGGAMGKVVLYRKDLFDEAGLNYPHNDWTWDDFYAACRRLTDPSRGIYGTYIGQGKQNIAYSWTTFLWSAGGDDLVYNELTDQWRAMFDSRQAAVAMDFFVRLCSEPWIDADGRRQRGYAYRDTDSSIKWQRGQIAMMFSNIEEKLFARINPDVTGMAPVPLGPTRIRGAELNSMMMGIFAGIEDPVVRDAAWEFIRFYDSPEAMAIRTRILVEGGLGRFINPKYLQRYGYDQLMRMSPPGWSEVFQIAIDTGRPEPYGRNSNIAYNIMNEPLERAIQMALAGELPGDEETRLNGFQELLRRAVDKANEKMIGIIPPEVQARRRFTAAVALVAIGVGFTLVFRHIARSFGNAAGNNASARHVRGRWRRHTWAYVLLAPAILTIFVWQYIPLTVGSGMAFQNYRIMGGSRWVWLDNFGDVLWDAEWWASVWNSLRYSLLVIALTFLSPAALAILLQEVPRGKLAFRLTYYLPAVVTGLVTVLLWKQFYDPTEYGVLNALLMKIPAIGFIALGVVLLWIAVAFARRLLFHDSRLAALLFLVGGTIVLYTCMALAWPILRQPELNFFQKLFATLPEPYRWLGDPRTAMVACVLPMVWAGVGPGSLIYLAALKGISDDFYEAGDVDGATFLDKVLFIVFPTLKPLLVINFVGVFIGAWQSSANILAMSGGGANTTVADLNIFYTAFMYLKMGPATAMAWMLGFMLVGFTVYQLRILSRMEFRTVEGK